jgi:Peptidoglycan-binding protein, CsiV
MRFLTVILLSLGVALPAFSATPSTPTTPAANYDIEILVFSIQAPEFEGSELWTRSDQPIDTTKAVAPRNLPPTVEFSKIANSLMAGGRYRILLEEHWVQSADTRSSVPPMLLANADNEINGTLRFYLSRYLHVELNVMYAPPAAIGGGDAPDYVIREQRRVRASELTYFDHPKFGVIVKVTPVPA